MAVNTERLDQLIEAGEKVVGTERSMSGYVASHKFVDADAFEQWRVSCLNFLEATYSRASFNYKNFFERCSNNSGAEPRAGLSILRAVKDDFDAKIELTPDAIGLAELPLHPRIAEVSLGLYADGYYDEAVLAASKSLINFVKEKSGKEIDGRPLMTEVFSQNNPILAFNDLSSKTDKDEQQGMMCLFEGAAQAIRNPRGHDFPGDSPERAMEYISFISMLAKFVSESRKVQDREKA